MIRAARPADIPDLQALERAANAMFRDLGMTAVVGFEPTSAADLAGMIEAGYAWVATDEADRPVAGVLLRPVDGNLHVEQVSVHPAYTRRRIGERLLGKADEIAVAEGRPALTLTTFRDVPWNAPYYERLGFRVLSRAELTPGEREISDRNATGPLGAWPRVTMKRPVPGKP